MTIADDVYYNYFGIIVMLSGFVARSVSLTRSVSLLQTFWDVEQFIWPNLLLLHPKMARAAMQCKIVIRFVARLQPC